MNNYSIKIVRRTDKQNAKGENPLILQIIINSRSKKISLKESIDPKFWDDKNSRAIGKGFKSLNVKLNKIKSDLEAHCSLQEAGMVSITFDLIGRYLKGKNDNDFYQLFDEIVVDKNLKEATSYKYSLLRKRLKSFKSNIYTSDIDYNFVKSFDSFLRKMDLKDGGAIYNMHKCLKSIIHQIYLMEKISFSPYNNFKFKGPKINDEYLNEDEVMSLRNLKLDDQQTKKYKLTKDMFLFSCYTGLRFVDCDCLLVKNRGEEKKPMDSLLKFQGIKSITPDVFFEELLPQMKKDKQSKFKKEYRDFYNEYERKFRYGFKEDFQAKLDEMIDLLIKRS